MHQAPAIDIDAEEDDEHEDDEGHGKKTKRMRFLNSLINTATDLYGGTHKKVHRSVTSTAWHIQNVDEEENFNEDGNDGDEEEWENDRSMDEDEDEVEGPWWYESSKPFWWGKPAITKFYLLLSIFWSLSRLRMSIWDTKVSASWYLLLPP